MTMHSEHHDHGIIHDPKWQPLWAALALLALSALALWFYAA
jgi:hypothetical protein